MRRPRPTVVTLILTLGIAGTAFAQESASPFSLRAPVLGRGLSPQQSVSVVQSMRFRTSAQGPADWRLSREPRTEPDYRMSGNKTRELYR